jgi:hypothetical protein
MRIKIPSPQKPDITLRKFRTSAKNALVIFIDLQTIKKILKNKKEEF